MARILESNKCALGGTLAVALLASFSLAQASTFKVLYFFKNDSDGGLPCCSSLVLDNNANLYGTTELPLGVGAVFELAPGGKETILYYFPDGRGGAEPDAVIMDNIGNLWGTTLEGGIGGGVIFEIDSGDKEKRIHTFKGSPHDGCVAEGAMVTDTSGNFHGTTSGCGKYQYGAVFTLAPNGSESLVYSFKGGRNGLNPQAGLTIDSEGNLYGTTDDGGRVGACSGAGGCGTIFRLAPNGTKTELYKFKGSPGDGYIPAGALIMDSSGNLYGTTEGGGRLGCFAQFGCGVVFKLAPDGTETVLHFFRGGRVDGANPVAGLIADAAGNLYGTTEFGGSGNSCNGAVGCGTVFEIAPGGTETILHKFNETTDGANPMGGLVADVSGNLYGTAYQGGQFGYGTVFEITP